MNTIMKLAFYSSISLLLSVHCVHASDKDALARAQYMLRQISAEKSRLAVENKKTLEESKEIKKELNILNEKYKNLIKKSKSNSLVLKSRLDKMGKNIADEKKEQSLIQGKLKQMSSENNRLKLISERQQRAINMCSVNNEKLYEINTEILKKYEEKGVWDSLAQSEPITGLSRVEIENIVDDYQYRMDDLNFSVEALNN